MRAEGVGFEPTRREDPPTRFPVARTRPDYATLPEWCDLPSSNRGGEGGIRTHGGGLPHTAFREQHLKPLGHLSATNYTGGVAADKHKTHRRMPMGCRGTPGRIRTSGLLVRNQTLYPLSYGRARAGGQPSRRMLILAYRRCVANSSDSPPTILLTVQIGGTNRLTPGCHLRIMPRTVVAQPECEG